MVKLQSASMPENPLQTEQATLHEFHRREGVISNAESLRLDLETGKVVVTTDAEIKQPRYVVIFRSDRPLDGSQQHNYVESRGVAIRQDGDSWHLSESEQASLPAKLQSNTHITREVRLALPQDSGDVEINLQRGSVDIAGSSRSVSCELGVGNITVSNFNGSLSTKQGDGHLQVTNSQGQLQSHVSPGGNVTIDGFTGSLQVELAKPNLGLDPTRPGLDLRTNSVRIVGLELTADSDIHTTQPNQSIEITSTSPSTTITTGGKPFIRASHQQLENGRIIRSDVDPNTKQVAADQALAEQALFLAEKSGRTRPIFDLRITGPGRVAIGQDAAIDPGQVVAATARKLLSFFPTS